MTYMEAITLFTSCLRIAWFRDHFVSSISVIFIWGLILSHSLMEYTVMCLLINYIGNKKHLSLWKAAIVVNLQPMLWD
ncbi:hypothetical protein L6164_002235 [Bauhinia variegata]|uniref:Uncharacterized protein n=1 Tax=Bauhinia variegata TaxID=167791 RepID=A0ACB9PXE3_BAUVA|nr:hypothetical protein L6164_002235 [Bauhinia variegata]